MEEKNVLNKYFIRYFGKNKSQILLEKIIKKYEDNIKSCEDKNKLIENEFYSKNDDLIEGDTYVVWNKGEYRYFMVFTGMYDDLNNPLFTNIEMGLYNKSYCRTFKFWKNE